MTSGMQPSISVMIPVYEPKPFLLTSFPVESNGKLVYEWHGEMSRASRLSSHPGDPLFLGGNGGSFQFDQILLEPLTDDRGQSLINP